MATVGPLPILPEVSVTEARQFRSIFDLAVRQFRPVSIVRGGRERGVLIAREFFLTILEPYAFHVDVIPEDGGRVTLWLNDLDIGGNGPSLREARSSLLSTVRAFVVNYFAEWDFCRHLPDRARLLPHVLRLALAQNNDELSAMLFGPLQAGDQNRNPSEAPTRVRGRILERLGWRGR